LTLRAKIAGSAEILAPLRHRRKRRQT